MLQETCLTTSFIGEFQLAKGICSNDENNLPYLPCVDIFQFLIQTHSANACLVKQELRIGFSLYLVHTTHFIFLP